MGSIFNKKEQTKEGICYTKVAVEADISLKVSYCWHPGIPGYDVAYALDITMNNRPVEDEFLTISCENSDVKIQDRKVIVPENVRNTNSSIDVTVKYDCKTASKDSIINIPLKSWEMTFCDDFDGDELNRDVWKSTRPWAVHEPPEDADTYEVVDRAQVVDNCYTVKDSMLNMLITDEPVYDPIGKKKFLFSECCLATKDSFKQLYGCFSSRISCAAFSGLNTAFWLLPEGRYSQNYTNFKSEEPNWGLSEIDILETSAAWGNGKRFCVTEHYYDYTDNYAHIQEGEYFEVDDKMTDFHIFTCVWFEDSIYYYIDDKLIRVTYNLQSNGVEGEGIKPAYMIVDVSCYLDNSWVGKRNFTKADLPISAKVDWVKAYK